MKLKSLIAAVAATTLLSACTDQYGRPNAGVTQGGGINKSDVGTVAGAIGGGVLGNQIGKGSGNVVATIGGTLLGAYLGNQVGGSLDNADRAMYNQTSQQALNDMGNGQSLPWHNAQSGNSGTITPTNYYQNNSGQHCREYTQTINVGGRAEKGYGTACLQPNGSWTIVQ